MTEQIFPDRVSFYSEDAELVGYFYRPPELTGNLACIVMAAGLGGTQDMPAHAGTAADFARAGFGVLTFDYQNFGESEGKPRQVVDIKKQLTDLKAAVAWARIHPDINPDKIILWGTSLGGAHVVMAAADDRRIAAVVAQNPYNGVPKHMDRPAEQARELVMATSKDKMRGWLGRQPYYIPITGTPDTVSVMANEEANEMMERMTSKTWRNEVAPRVLSQLAKYKPSRKANEVLMPLMVCVGKNDKEAPPELVNELAQKAPLGQLKTYPFGHFDFYKIAHRHEVIEDQVKFLRTYVPV